MSSEIEEDIQNTKGGSATPVVRVREKEAMSDIFKKKADCSVDAMLDELGASAEDIIDAGSERNSNHEVAFEGAVAISRIVRESKKCFGLDVKPNSMFGK